MAGAHMERCANCRTVHYTKQHPALYLGGHYYCKPSCANAHRLKEKPDAYHLDPASDIVLPIGKRES